MTPSLTAIRPLVTQNLLAIIVCGLVGLVLAFWLAADRAAPVRFIEGSIVPETVTPGQAVSVQWLDVWVRQCEATLSRELVGSDEIIRAYRSHPIRVPVKLGEQMSQTRFRVSANMPDGPATYRAILRFNDCGVTSRWWPIVVKVPSLHFTVHR